LLAVVNIWVTDISVVCPGQRFTLPEGTVFTDPVAFIKLPSNSSLPLSSPITITSLAGLVERRRILYFLPFRVLGKVR